MEEIQKPTEIKSEKPLVPLETESRNESECLGKCCSKPNRWCSMKRDHKIAIGVLVLLLLVAGANHYKGFFVAATVNGEAITRLEVIRDLEKQSGSRVLETLVTNKIIHNAAITQNFHLAAADFDAEIANIRQDIEGQGLSLENALLEQGMSMEDLRKQITPQLELEKILGDKIAVTDEEVAKYISDNKIPSSKDMTEEELRQAIKKQLKSQKLGREASVWIEAEKAKASIQYLAPYSLSLNTPAKEEVKAQ